MTTLDTKTSRDYGGECSGGVSEGDSCSGIAAAPGRKPEPRPHARGDDGAVTPRRGSRLTSHSVAIACYPLVREESGRGEPSR